jgi:hypothetical protein
VIPNLLSIHLLMIVNVTKATWWILQASVEGWEGFWG